MAKSKAKPASANRKGKQPTKPATKPESPDFPVVGIGASAGGLEAFTNLLHHLPTDTGMGFVLIQHLDPTHESALSSLLARATRIPVREVTDRMEVKPNNVYVIPPKTNMTLQGSTLRLTRRDGARKPYMPVDEFFESLAKIRKHRAV